MMTYVPITSLPNSVSATPPATVTKFSKNKTPTWRSAAATPPALFTPQIHHRVAEVAAEVDAYFLKNWPFQDDKTKNKFVGAGFSHVTCLYFPAAMDERIAFACRLLALLFLVDGKSQCGPLTWAGRLAPFW